MQQTGQRLIKGGVGFLLQNLFGRGFGFLFWLVGAALMPPEELGLLALGWAVLQIAESLALLGLRSSVNRFLSGDEHSRTTYYSSSVLIAILGVILVTFILYLLLPSIAVDIFGSAELEGVLMLILVTMPASAGILFMRRVFEAQETMRSAIFCENLRNVLRMVALALVALLYSNDAYTVSCGVALSQYAAWFVLIFLTKRKLPRFELAIGKERFKEVLVYSLPLCLMSISAIFATLCDRLMLGYLSTVDDVAVYTFVSSIVKITTIIYASAVGIFHPVAGDLHKQGKIPELIEIYRRVIFWTLRCAFLISILIAGFAYHLVPLMNPDYAGDATYMTFLLLLIVYALGAAVGPAAGALQVCCGQIAVMRNSVIFLVVSIGTNYLLIPAYGVSGAALATLLSTFILSLAQVVEVRKLFTFWAGKMVYFYEFLGFLVLLCVFWIVRASVFSIALAVVASLFVVVLTYIQSTSQERDFIRQKLKRASKKSNAP